MAAGPGHFLSRGCTPHSICAHLFSRASLLKVGHHGSAMPRAELIVYAAGIRCDFCWGRKFVWANAQRATCAVGGCGKLGISHRSRRSRDVLSRWSLPHTGFDGSSMMSISAVSSSSVAGTG
jgi:hypothetical protein